MPTATTKITLPELHPAQWDIISHPARFRVAACGRRFGKTQGAAAEAVACASEGGRVWWVAPTYDVTKRGWRNVLAIAKQIPGTDVHRGDREIYFPGGGFIAFKTTKTGASLLGEGLDLLIVDEAALVPEEAWIQDLRPALSDRQGRALFIGTPRGRNWFWRAFVRGQDPEQDDWQSWRLPTSENPFILASEIESARQLMPQRTFEQEYLAEFLADGGAVFRNVTACAVMTDDHEPDRNYRYVFGVDWGKSEDFTAIAVLRQDGALVKIDRFNEIGWSLQRARLIALYEKWRPTVIIAETNAMGDPNVEALQHEGLPVDGFETTAQSKTPLIESLALAFERQEIAILNDPVLVGELQSFTMERLPSGRFRYSAPSGMHDDTVIALALAWHGANNAPLFDAELYMAPQETYGIGPY